MTPSRATPGPRRAAGAPQLALAALAALAAACGDKVDPVPCGAEEIATIADTSYDRDIQPLLTLYCVRCHSATLTGEQARHSAPADLDFDTWSDTLGASASPLTQERRLADLVDQVVSGAMPPDQPDRVRLREKCAFVAWQAGEYAE